MVLLFGFGPGEAKDLGEVAPSGEQVLQPPAAGAMPGSGGAGELSEKLASLDRLHQAGELTDEEFTAAKRRLLES